MSISCLVQNLEGCVSPKERADLVINKGNELKLKTHKSLGLRLWRLLKCRRKDNNTAMAERIYTDFGSLDNNELWQRGMAVVLALMGNVRFPNPPVTMALLKSLLDAFKAAITDAMEGSKKAMALWDSLRAQVISALKQVAAYVQENANSDFSKTGFETYDTAARKTSQLVETPTFRKLDHGSNSGEIMLLINAVPHARAYQVQYTALKDGIPGPWTVVDVMSVKSAFKISGLTPATMYAFQVQAIGPNNRSDWSNSVTIICV